jgi:hypothetical protein
VATIQYGSGEGAGLFDSAGRVSDFFVVAIADRDVSVLAHPAITYLGDANGAQSSIANIPVVNLTDDLFASVTEVQSGSGSDITTDLAAITIARRYLARDLSDMAASLDNTGALEPMTLVDAMLTSANMTLLSLVATVGATFATVKGTSGATMTHATIREARQALRTNSVPGPYVCVLNQKQYNEWETDIQSLGGSVQMSEQAQDMSRLTGGSYQGSWDGIDFFVSDKVVTDGTDLNGCMFGANTIGWRSLTTKPAPGQELILDGGFVKVEVERVGSDARTELQGNMWVGVALIQDKGVRLRSVD